jgi:hypothetical protein
MPMVNALINNVIGSLTIRRFLFTHHVNLSNLEDMNGCANHLQIRITGCGTKRMNLPVKIFRVHTPAKAIRKN